MHTFDFVVGVFLLLSLAVSFIYWNLKKPAQSKQSEGRIEEEVKTTLPALAGLYRTFGGWLYWMVEKIVKVYEVSPNAISTLGLVFAILSSVAISFGVFSIASLLSMLSGLSDIADGFVARQRKQTTKSGAFSDSVIDRVGELFIFGGFVLYFSRQDDWIFPILTFFAFGFSFLISYERARAESLGVKMKEGFLRRQERMVGITVALLFDSIVKMFRPPIFVKIVIIAILILAIITSAQRFFGTIKKLRESEKIEV